MGAPPASVAPPPAAMLSQIKLRDFRCFDSLHVPFEPGVQFFIGDNAQGKTSILEAVCVLLRLASPRSSTLAPLIRLGAADFSVQGQWTSSRLQFSLGAAGRKLLLDEVEQSATADYLRLARVVYFGNADVDLVRGGAEGRRRYLDFLGSQIEPLYRANLRSYERALRSRNRLLKAVPPRLREVEAYTPPLLEAGGLLTQLRRSLVTELLPWVLRAQARIRTAESVGPEQLAIEYRPGATADFAAALAASREEEVRLRQTLIGPHRDDLLLTLDAQPAATFGSEGQQRTLALALKLAQAGFLAAIWRKPPILLLDDIFGELDPARRNALLAALPSGAQQIVTTTHLTWLDGPAPGPVWRLRERRLEPVPGG
jgi:DNA replication and repair protein RecF